MFKRPKTVQEYSRLDQHEDKEEEWSTLPNSVLVANHHGQCNVVPLLSQASHPTHTHHSPRTSFAAAEATRRFFQTKLPVVFRKELGSTASFSSLPAVIVADLQCGHIPSSSDESTTTASNMEDYGWTILHRRRFRGKGGVGETRRPLSPNSSVIDMDEEIDPSDQVTCSVFVLWDPNHQDQQQQQYTMTMRSFHEPFIEEEDDRHFDDPIPTTEQNFAHIIQTVRTAIDNNMQPTRISQGSSGSYFCRNSSGKIVGVFKPKNEEPYGRLNPKWTKWIHRHLFPCFFGRSCLIPNLGYLSEAGASLIDRRLGTMIVPYTDVIQLSSTSFHYDYLDRRLMPEKIGSFQCFLTNYKDATVFFRDYPFVNDYSSQSSLGRRSVWGGCLGGNGIQEETEEEMQQQQLLDDVDIPDEDNDDEEDSDHTEVTDPASKRQDTSEPTSPPFRWTHQLQDQFRREFEQLVILDYLIRNTDRGLDNWMVKYCPSTLNTTGKKKKNNTIGKKAHIHVAAIDNGLAFPYKHPDQWRSYPYGWMAMPEPMINRPFSKATRTQFLKILTNPLWWRETVREMRALFEMDDDFDEKMFQRQMAVLKGQGFNIVRTLKDENAGPIDLVAMERVVINQEEVLIEYDESILQKRDLHQASHSPRRLRTKRSTSFDIISTTSFDEDLERAVGRSSVPPRTKKWKDKVRSGLSIDLGRGGRLFGITKKKKQHHRRYRGFESDGDISDSSSEEDSEDEERPKRKQVTVIMERIETVKSRTYFTCC
ncbi:hypothetical protein K501DRAFT_250578 [Backusella circina FSU 941]|nr:hypothetical protein K501DRAFT_250578 [Backusella circina FSU 941]